MECRGHSDTMEIRERGTRQREEEQKKSGDAYICIAFTEWKGAEIGLHKSRLKRQDREEK